MSRSVCVLAGGGLDSGVLIGRQLRLGREVHPLYVRFGLRWERAELFWLRRYLRRLSAGPQGRRLKPLSVARVSAERLWGPHWSIRGAGVPGARAAWDSVKLPGRNLLLLSAAAVLCERRGIGAVALGSLKGNPFLDARPGFHRALARAVGLGLGSRLKIEAPFRRLDKRQVLALGGGLPLELTFSCLKPAGLRACGRCSKCWERKACAR